MAVIGAWGGGSPEDPTNAMRDLLGPQAVDNAIRQAISMCWMALPDHKRNVAEVEVEMRRLFERALRNLKEDAMAFGIPEVP